jgi:hypothetical protein
MAAKTKIKTTRATAKRAIKAPAKRRTATVAAHPPRSARGGETRADLYAQAVKFGIAGCSRMSKVDMLAAVTEVKAAKAQARADKKAAKLAGTAPAKRGQRANNAAVLPAEAAA